jgi:arylsulfatase A
LEPTAFIEFMKRLISALVYFGFFFICGGLNGDSAKPNIIVFLADDLGYGSTNPYGADPALVRTPAINRLAGEGVRFTRAYTTGSVCSPTRYGLLTGRYSWRSRLKKGVINNNDPMLIDAETETIASWLQEQDYATAAVGKWHLGYTSSKFANLLGTISPGPLDVGFDYHFGVPNNLDDLHKVYIENDRIYGLRSDKMSKYSKSYYGKPYVGYDAPQRVTTEVMDTITEKAIRWIDSVEKDKPFFLYFGSVAVHHPIAPSERMRGTSNAGAYGDFIHDVDYSVGQLMDALERRGLSENTIFVFTSDNGGEIPIGDDRPEVQAQKAGLASNGSLRGDKHTIFNGGFAVPFIVRWPGHHDSGISNAGLVSTADLFATIADVVSGKVPSPESGGTDSFSFLPLLRNAEASDRPHAVLRDAKGRQALLFGDWKYIDDVLPDGEVITGTDSRMLFNLNTDPGETTDVVTDHPQVVERARKLLAEIRNRPSSRTIPL